MVGTPRWRSRGARFVLVAVGASIALGTGIARAQTGPPGASSDASVQSLREQAEQASGAYFAALSHYQALTSQIASIQAQLPQLKAEELAHLKAAVGRAVVAYEQGGGAGQLAVVMDSNDLLDAARRTQWLDALNQADDHSLADLKVTSGRLRTEEKTLQNDQAQSQSALKALEAQGQAINVELTAAVTRQQQEAAAAAPGPSGGAASGGGSASGSAGNVNYAPTPGSNPHHNDPFLTCIRAHESGGNYGVVNPAGPYLGAYQFLEATWNSTANHAGETQLIGVPANQASAYDQDQMAWDLYQWQGKGPWAGDPC